MSYQTDDISVLFRKRDGLKTLAYAGVDDFKEELKQIEEEITKRITTGNTTPRKPGEKCK